LHTSSHPVNYTVIVVPVHLNHSWLLRLTWFWTLYQYTNNYISLMVGLHSAPKFVDLGMKSNQ
jgi:hypothetical protein